MPTFIEHLDRERIIEASRHTHAVWSSGRSLDDHAAYTLGQVERAGPDLFRYVGLVDDTGLVASAKRYSLLLAAPDRRPLPAVGIGAVFTRQDARGRGLASTLIREILREATAQGACAAWLHCEIDPGFYARLGFAELPGVAHHAPAAQLPGDAPLDHRPATPDDMDRLLAWYEESFDDGWLRPARSTALWNYFSFRNSGPAFLLQDGGKDVGYLSADTSHGVMWVNEWSAPGIERPRLLATVRKLAEQHGLADVAGWLRPDQVDGVFSPSPRKSGVPMIHHLAPPWTTEKLDPSRTHFGSFEYF
ncbi:GNAT family N-acetyltransferase [Chondromyces crocatus]|uniref:N-acetyltransferase domain-containing protein n=1 Tax=Chondromyces crocatus TaxID=52 RepID=A0A0K1EH63_CHOCO|nr:GNAT family N-acetyltransferase [Chondromyces crocatus]AKT40189.1 uncharacterized protein CMC5_043420 [Chondromyces crocatus]